MSGMDERSAHGRENIGSLAGTPYNRAFSTFAPDTWPMTALVQQLAQEIAASPAQIEAAIRLIDDGASVPFIARYRKEATGGLDDVQLRQLEARLAYLRDLHERRAKALESIDAQGRLTDELRARIEAAPTKNALEELYAPYRPRKTSKAGQAREAGLAPIAEQVRTQAVDPVMALEGFAHDQYPDQASQLEALQHLIIEEWATDLALTDLLRRQFASDAVLKSTLVSEEKRDVGKKFRDYFDSQEPLAKVADHRLLAMLRGRQENVLALKVDGADAPRLAEIFDHLQLGTVEPPSRREFLQDTANLFWNGKIRPQIEHSLLTERRLAAEADAIRVFADNLRHLLLSAPAGGRRTLGLDPGLRHGVKMAVVDESGQVLDHGVIFPFAPKNDRDGALAEIERLCRAHQVDLIAIGNGTASRETESLVTELQKQHPDLNVTRVVVNESGASVYSASELASSELPELDVSIRGAVSIARRLQDPLAELVKIDPKSIGVGQYQHDVNQTQLAQMLDTVVEDCVNAVGVDVNTASAPLLARIAGLGAAVAQQIVDYRREHGRFEHREQLKLVPRLGARTFEQAAGFLRILGGSQPLDASAVHPESYALVQQMLEAQGLTLHDVMGQPDKVQAIAPEAFVSEQHGLPTVTDVLRELEKPGRDPRPAFRTAQFRDDIQKPEDLTNGLILEGVVTNVTNFGAFVDIGVHQDGLVHISELGSGFVNDPQQVVKPGQIVQVRVLGVDQERKRISLSLRLNPTDAPARPPRRDSSAPRPERSGDAPRRNESRPPRGERPPRRDGERRPQERALPHEGKPRQEHPAREPAEPRLGTLGALLQQAGLRKGNG